MDKKTCNRLTIIPCSTCTERQSKYAPAFFFNTFTPFHENPTPMPVRKLLAILMLSLFGLPIVTAQVDFRNFPMDSFKLPDIDVSGLLFTGSLFGNYTQIDKETSGTNIDSRFYPNFGFDYSRFINRTNLQATVNASLDQGLSFSNGENFFGVAESETNYDSRFQVIGSRKKYKGTSYIETGVSVFTDYEYDRSSINEEKDNRFFGDISGTIGFGKGRIEPISDVAMAMFVLRDAMELGLDGSSITTESIYEFASLMAQVRSRRIFDTRRKRVAELRDLYSFMQSKDWVIPNDPGFFTVLTDNWIYNPLSFRNTGSRWRYVLSPEVHYSSYRNRDVVSPETNQKNIDFGASIEVDYNKYKPVSLFRDNTRRHSISAGITNSQMTANSFEDQYTYVDVNLGSSTGKNWYPNNRTTIRTVLSAEYSYYRYIDTPEFSDVIDQHYFRTGISGQCTYFLSYRTRLVADTILQYYNDTGGNIVPHYFTTNFFNSSEKSNGIHARLSGTLVVDLF